MPTIEFGMINKRINSTKNTFAAGSTSLSCRLKEPCSIQKPTFIVQGLSKVSPNYNYCKWGSRCYWIDEITYLTNSIMEVSCHIDVLGTYKGTIINNGTGFIEYTSNKTYWNKLCDELRLNPERQPGVTPLPTKFSMFKGLTLSQTGTIVMKVMAFPIGGSNHGVRAYAMDMSTFSKCLTDLSSIFDNYAQTHSTSIAEFAAKCYGAMGGIGSWQDNILSITYLPIDISAFVASGIDVSSDGITVGSVSCGAPPGGTIYLIPAVLYYQAYDETLSLPWTQLQNDLPFLKNPRWCSLQLIYPGGCQSIDITNLKDQASMGWYTCLDMCTGEWSAKLTEKGIDSSQVLATCSGNIGVDIRGLVNTKSTDTLAITAIGAMAGLVLGGIGGAGVSGSTLEAIETSAVSGAKNAVIGAGISGTFANMGIRPSAISGGLGSGGTGLFACNASFGKCFLALVTYEPWGLTAAYYDQFCAEYGYPCNVYSSFANFANYYIKCSRTSFAPLAAATKEEIAEINQYLNGTGIYLE